MGVPLQQQWVQQRLSLLDLPSTLLGAFHGEHFGYKYLLGALFYVVNSPTRMVAAVLNCFFGALTVVFAYRIARTLFSEWVAVRVGWWTCLLPSLIVWSGQTVKEPAVIFLEALALYGCVNLRRSGFSVRHVALCAAATILVIPFRFYVAYIIAGAIVSSLLLPHFTRRKMSIGSALIVVIVLVPLLLLSGVLIRHESQLDRFDAKFISTYRHGLTVGAGTGVETNYDIRTNQGLAMATLIGGAYLLLAPFPWELGGTLRKMLTTPELFVWWWLVVSGVDPRIVVHREKKIQRCTTAAVFRGGPGSPLQRHLWERRFGLPTESAIASLARDYRHGRTRTARVAQAGSKATILSAPSCAKTCCCQCIRRTKLRLTAWLASDRHLRFGHVTSRPQM